MRGNDDLDVRVVELQFNNSQFESGVKQSLGTLDRLKAALKFDKATDGIQNVQRAASSFSLTGMANNIESLSNRFSAMGIVGMTVIQNLTNGVLNFVRTLPTKLLGFDPIGQIISGGKSRAANIEQAKFQLSGLGIAWEKVSDSINYAVQDTAYGMDAAAKAASQLAASGVALGDDMTHALTGISGVAAMTNSEYEDIARIFTTVAGNGRLMGDQLNQIAGRGLNVAAELAKNLGKSEGEIRKMVSQGKIDFKTFAEAMYDAYGEHAKDAQKTFTGAMSNIRAACSRMGQPIAASLRDNAIEPLGKLRDILNSLIKVGFVPIYEDFAKVSEKAGKALSNILSKVDVTWVEKIAKGLVNIREGLFGLADTAKNAFSKLVPKSVVDGVTSLSDKFYSFSERFKDTLVRVKETVKPVTSVVDDLHGVSDAVEDIAMSAEELESVAKRVISGEFKSGDARKKALAELGYSYSEVQNKVNELLGCSKRHSKEEDYEIKASNEHTEATKELAEATESYTLAAVDAGSVSGRFERAFLGLGAALNIVKKAAYAVKELLVKPFFAKVLPAALNTILSIAAGIGDVIFDINSKLEKNKTIESFVSNVKSLFAEGTKLDRLGKAISSGLSNLSDFFSRFYTKFKAFLNVTNKVAGVKRLKESLHGLKEDLSSILGDVGEKFVTWIEKITGKELKVPDFSKAFGFIDFAANSLATLVDYLRSGISYAKEFIAPFASDVFSSVSEALGTLGNNLNSVFKPFEDGLVGYIKDFFSSFGKGDPTQRLTGLSTALESVDGVLKELFGFVYGFITGGEDSTGLYSLLKTGGLIFVIFKIVTAFKKLTKAASVVNTVRGIPKKISDFISGLTKYTKAETMKAKAEAIKEVAKAIGIIALSLVALSAIDTGKLVYSAGVVAAIIFAISKLTQQTSNVKVSSVKPIQSFLANIASSFRDFVKMASFSTTLIAVAIAISIVAGQLVSLKDLDWASGLRSAVYLAAISGILLGAAYVLEKMLSSFDNVSSGQLLSAAAGMLLIALSIKAIVPAMLSLTNMPWEDLAKAGVAIVALMISLAAALGIAQQYGGMSGAVGMVAMAVSVTLIANALKKLTKIKDINKLNDIAKILSLAMIGLSAALVIAGQSGTGKGALAILGMTAAILLLTPALLALGKYSDIAGQGLVILGILAAGLIALSSVAGLSGMIAANLLTISSALLAFGGSIFVISAAAFVFSAAVALFGVGLGILTGTLLSFGTSLTGFLTMLIINGELFRQALATVLSSVSLAVIESSGDIIKALISLIVDVCEALNAATPTILDSLGTLLIRILLFLDRMVPTISFVLVGFVINVFNSLSQAIIDHSDALFDAIETLLKSLRYFIVSGVLHMLNDAIGWIPGIGSTINGLIEKLNQQAADSIKPAPFEQRSEEALFGAVQGIKNKTPDLVQASLDASNAATNGYDLSGILEETSSKTNASVTIMDDFSNRAGVSSSGVTQQISDNFNLSGLPIETGDSLNEVAGLMSDFVPTGADLSGGVTTAINENFDPRLDVDMSESVDGMISSLTGSSGEAGGAAALLSGAVESNAALDPATFEGLSADGISSYISGITDSAGAAGDAAGSFGETAVGEIRALIPDYSAAGDSSAVEYAKAINNRTGLSQRAGSNVAAYGAAGADSKRGGFKNAGEYAGQGFVNGLRSKLGASTSAGSAIAAAALNAARRTLDEHSPSKAFGIVGSYGGEGFVDGLVEWIGKAAKAASEMADGALVSAQKSMANADSLFMPTSEYNPVVRPVMDLSNIQNGQSTIGGLLNDRTMRLAGQASVSLSADRVSFEETLAQTVESAITRAMDNFKEHEDLQPYEIVVPINYNGREVSRVTAPFIRADLNKRDMHELRKVGVV